jgi:hypothetical protein
MVFQYGGLSAADQSIIDQGKAAGFLSKTKTRSGDSFDEYLVDMETAVEKDLAEDKASTTETDTDTILTEIENDIEIMGEEPVLSLSSTLDIKKALKNLSTTRRPSSTRATSSDINMDLETEITSQRSLTITSRRSRSRAGRKGGGKKKASKKKASKKKASKNNKPLVVFGAKGLNKGMVYEEAICNILGSSGAGATHNVPDCLMTKGPQNIPLEVKLSLSADFGQINLDYDDKKKKFVWTTRSSNDDMKAYYNNLSVEYKGNRYNNVLDFVNGVWNTQPEKFKLKRPDRNASVKAWIQDKLNFKSIIVYVPFQTIISFYSNKVFNGHTSNYIQIGHGKAISANSKSPTGDITVYDSSKSLGLYYLNTDDIKGHKISKFTTNFKPDKNNLIECCKLRLRLKTNSSGSGGKNPAWSFLVALQCVKVPKSGCSLDDDKRNKGLKSTITFV